MMNSRLVAHKLVPMLGLGSSRVSSRTLLSSKVMWSDVLLRHYAKAKELTLPALSPTMDEGVIVAWVKKEGEAYKAGDVLFQLQTDKSVLDVEAIDDGILAKVLVQAGSPPLPVNSTIGFTAEKGDDLSKLEYPAGKPASKPQAVPQTPPPSKPQQPSQPQQSQPQQQKQPQQESQQHHHSDSTVFPSVRRLLSENGLDISQVKGTGPHGRVVKGDVINAISNKQNLPPASSKPAAAEKAEQSKPAPAKSTTSSTQNYEDTPTSTVIARRLTESKTRVPHMYVTAECNIDALLAMRSRLNELQKVKLSVNDFILKAAALTLRDIPAANATWTENSIRLLKDVDVSVAVATDKGLITPIVKHTDKKGLATIATELKELAARARTGNLKPHEFQGGSFSVSNLGMFGISHFIAVINPPQAAILAVGAGRKEIRLNNTNATIDLDSYSASSSSPAASSKVVNVVDVTLSCDNRVIDEELAGKFLERFQKYMSTPEMLVL